MEQAARRRFLKILAGAGVVAAAGGGAAFMANSGDAAAYDAAVEATWRHSDHFELPLPVAQKELVRYATLAANSHNTQPWRFRFADHAIFVAPDSRRRLSSVDPDDHHLFASLGCATENLVQAAAAFGLRANATFDPAAGGIRVRPRTGACGPQRALRRDPATSVNTRHFRRTGCACPPPSPSGSSRERQWRGAYALHRTQSDGRGPRLPDRRQ